MEVQMFSVGDRVIHPGQGLCTVVEIRNAPSAAGGSAGSSSAPAPCGTLVLQATCGRSLTKLMCPIDRAEEMLHPPVTHDEALAAIAAYPTMETDGFTDHNSGIEERHFKALVKRGVPESLRAVKTVCERIAQAESAGKKPSTYLARVLREARGRSLEELSAALGVTEEDVPSMFGPNAGDFSDEA